jgi:hypothetical protein
VTENNPNPFNNPAFRKEMSEMFDDKISGISEIQTQHNTRITALERWRWYIVGGGTVLLVALKLLAGH